MTFFRLWSRAPLDDQARRRLADQALQAHADVLPRAEVGAGQRVGALDRLGRAVEDDLAAALARARAHVDQAIGGEHHRRVVLDDDQRVAGVAQAVHRLDDPAHVARVQADRRLVEDEQGVDERGAERGRQVDALHLAARERAALAVEREVADADVAEVAQPRPHFVEEELERFVEQAARQRQAIEEAADAVDRQHHQVVHGEAGHRLELLARPAARRPAGSASPAPSPRRRRPSCRGARAAPRASGARRRTPGTACSCGTSTRARGCASCRPSTRGSRRSA